MSKRAEICKPCDCIDEQNGVGFKLAWFVNRQGDWTGAVSMRRIIPSVLYQNVSSVTLIPKEEDFGSIWLAFLNVESKRNLGGQHRRKVTFVQCKELSRILRGVCTNGQDPPCRDAALGEPERLVATFKDYFVMTKRERFCDWDPRCNIRLQEKCRCLHR